MTTHSNEPLVIDAATAMDLPALSPSLGWGDRADDGGRGSPPKGRQDPTVAIDASDMEARLADLSTAMPLPQAALDVFQMTRAGGDSGRIAEVIAQDESLRCDILGFANSPYFASADATVAGLRDAVDRLGPGAVGDLALATRVLATLAPSAAPWLKVDLVSRRCIAAAVAVNLLASPSVPEEVREGLFLNALVHPLCRIARGALYSRQYGEMVRQCSQRGETLDERETRAFPLGDGEVVQRLATGWGLPLTVFEPLMYLGGSFESLASLPEPLRAKTELLKLAVAIGRLAAGEWNAWDRVEVPPAFAVKRPRGDRLAAVLQRTRASVGKMIAFGQHGLAPNTAARQPAAASSSPWELTYCSLSPQPFDFLAEIVSSMGIRLMPRQLDDVESDEDVLVNCLWVFPHRLGEWLRQRSGDGRRLIATDVTHLKPCSRFGQVLLVPGSYGAIRQACTEAARTSRMLPR